MIARVAVASSALRENAEQRTPRELTLIHRSTAELLLAHGLLVFADNRAQQDFVRAVTELGRTAPGASKAWETAMLMLRVSGRTGFAGEPTPVALDVLARVDELTRCWKGRIEVAVVDDSRATRLGVGEDDLSWVEPASKIEITRVEASGHCQRIDALQRQAATGCATTGSRRDDVWRLYFEPIVRHAGEIHILDRYAGTNVVRQDEDPRAGDFPPRALPWLFRKIDEIRGSSVDVQLYTGSDGPAPRGASPRVLTANDVATALTRTWGGTPGQRAISSVQVYVAQWNGALPHDRHLWADISCCVEVPAGFDRFDRRSLREDVALVYRWLPEPLEKARREEEAVRTDASVSSAVLA